MRSPAKWGKTHNQAERVPGGVRRPTYDGDMSFQATLPLDLPQARGVGRNTTTFVDNMKLPVHRWFRYSAGFSAQWVRQIIEELGAQRVFDPFAGSGTTIIAAEEQGVEGLGVDIHPFVSRVARAKLQWRADPGVLLTRAQQVVRDVEQRHDFVAPESPLVARCFPDSVALASLIRLRDSIERSRKGDVYDELLWLAMVSIIRACSPVGTAQWQYVLPNQTKSRVAEPLRAFDERVRVFAQDMETMVPHLASPRGVLVETDARELQGVEDGWADLVITSPPYANNFDYADAARLEQSFLGEISGWGDLKPLRDLLMKSATQQMGRWDPAEAIESPELEPIRTEIMRVYEELSAARSNKPGNKAYNLMIVGYFYDSARIFRSLRRVTQRGARVCYVVGDSAPYGVHVPVEKWLGDLAVSVGFDSWSFDKVRDRNVKWKNRKHTHPLHEGRLWIEG